MNDVGSAIQGNQAALERLTPAAQAFARTIQSEVIPHLNRLRASAQEGLFSGLNRALEELVDPRVLGTLNRVLAETGRTLGNIAAQLAQRITTPEWLRDLQTVGARNNEILATLGRALGNVLDGLRNLMVAGGPFVSWLARSVELWTQRSA